MVYVADTASVDEFSTVEGDARVEGCAVLEHSRVSGFVVVYGSAKLFYSFLFDAARVGGRAVLLTSDVRGAGRVYGDAVLDSVRVLDSSCVFGGAQLALAWGETIVELRGDCKFGGSASFEGLSTLEHFVHKYGADKVQLVRRHMRDNCDLIILTDVWDMG